MTALLIDTIRAHWASEDGLEMMEMNHKKWTRKFAGRDSGRWLKHHAAMYSAPRLDGKWYATAAGVIENYPALQAEHAGQLADIKRGAADRRPVELTVMRSMPHKRQRAYNAVVGAINECKRVPHGSTAIQVIKYRYWSGAEVRPSLRRTARTLGITSGRAGQAERLFFGAVVRRMGHKIEKSKSGCAR